MTSRRTALLLAAAALAGAAGLVAPASADNKVVEPCHGDTYKHGAYVWLPGADEPMRMCIEQ